MHSHAGKHLFVLPLILAMTAGSGGLLGLTLQGCGNDTTSADTTEDTDDVEPVPNCNDEAPQPMADMGIVCEVKRLGYHRGGNHPSNACADRFGPNDFWDPGTGAGNGSDAQVLCVSYDGIVQSRNPSQYPDRVYEMKNYDWRNADKYPDSKKPLVIARDLRQMEKELRIAILCGLQYQWVTTNETHWTDVTGAIQRLQDHPDAGGFLPDGGVESFTYDKFSVEKYQGCPEAFPF